MKVHSSEIRLTRVLVATFVVVLASGFAFSQGGSGRKPNLEPPSTPRSAPKNAKPPAAKRKGPTSSRPSSRKSTLTATFGSMTITVTEPGSEVFITDKRGVTLLDGEPQVTAGDGSPLIAERLRAGVYSIVVRKEHYFEERRQVTVIGGKTLKVVVTLRPSVAFLTIKTNVEKPEIEIRGVGVLTAGVNRAALKPGYHEVTVRRKGYIAGTKTITISMPGTDNVLIFDLRPVPVAEILAEAESQIERRDLSRAIAVCSDVLEINPEHPRAHLLIGRARFLSGSSDAPGSLLRAIQLGEVVSLTVRSFAPTKPLGVVSGELLLDRNYIKFRNNYRPDLNFSLFKTNISDLALSLDQHNVRYVSFRGTGDFNGKPAGRRISLYSDSVALRTGETFCPPTGSAPDRCGSDAANLHNLLAAWLAQQ